MGAAQGHYRRLLQLILHRVQGPHQRVRRISAREVCARLSSTVLRMPALDSAWVRRSLRSRPSAARRLSSLATTGCCPATGLGWGGCSTSLDTRETTCVCTHACTSNFGLSRGS